MPDTSKPDSLTMALANRPRENQLPLAVGLLLVELVAGIQTYLSQTVLPLMASDLDARSMYGVVTAAVAVAYFAGLPLGLGLAARFRIPRLLIGFTVVICGGAIISALAPTIWLFMLGGVIRGFASGCIATVSMGAVVVGLSGRVRQVTLSAMSAMWVIAALFGPTYAAWISHALSWRWAMVLYLPILFVARSIVARHLPDHEQSQDSQIGWRDSALLALAMVFISIHVDSNWLQLLLLAAGIVLLAVATRRALPSGTFRLTSRRRTATAFMFGLCGLYLAVDSVVAIVAHDAFGASAAEIGLVIMAGGLTWALVGLYCGWKPAQNQLRYFFRSITGIGVLAIGIVWMSLAGHRWFGLSSVSTLAAGWALAGVGMGLCYVDTLNVLFTPPNEADQLSDLDVSNAAAISETVGAAATTTIATSFLANGYGASLSIDGRSSTLLTVTAIATIALAIPLLRMRTQTK